MILASVLGIILGRNWPLPSHQPLPVPVSSPSIPTITQIQQLAELVTARVTIADARETDLSGYLGGVKAILVIRGDALLGPDLSKATIVSCDNSTKTLVISLPRPRVISYRLDHTTTHLVSLSHDGLWVIVPGDAGRTAVLNRAYAEAERAVGQAAVTAATIEQASEYTQHGLESFFVTGGWTIQVEWERGK